MTGQSDYAHVVPELLVYLTRLADSADAQVKYLKDLGVYPLVDELALEMNDVVGLLELLARDGLLTEDQANAIRSVDRKLDQMSGEENAALWTPQSLQSSPEWAEVRSLAKRAIGKFRSRPSTQNATS